MALRISSIAAVLGALVMLGTGACATKAEGRRSLPLDFHSDRADRTDHADQADAAVVSIPTPQTPDQAGALIAEAVELLQKQDNAAAMQRLEAVLRCDFLSERGRANLYWLLAGAARGRGDDRRRDALSGYLVAASILPPDAFVQEKMARARAMLLADQVQAGLGVGASPHQAISIDSIGEADALIAHLGCGLRRQAPYVTRDVREPQRTRTEPRDGLQTRRLL